MRSRVAGTNSRLLREDADHGGAVVEAAELPFRPRDLAVGVAADEAGGLQQVRAGLQLIVEGLRRAAAGSLRSRTPAPRSACGRRAHRAQPVSPAPPPAPPTARRRLHDVHDGRRAGSQQRTRRRRRRDRQRHTQAVAGLPFDAEDVVQEEGQRVRRGRRLPGRSACSSNASIAGFPVEADQPGSLHLGDSQPGARRLPPVRHADARSASAKDLERHHGIA